MGVSAGDRSDPARAYAEYEVVSKSDKEVTVRRTYYHDVGGGNYDPDKKEEYPTSSSDCKFVLTDKGWRVETVFDSRQKS